MIVRHIASHTSMKESGPDASAPTPFTGARRGRPPPPPRGPRRREREKIPTAPAPRPPRRRRFAQGGKAPPLWAGGLPNQKAFEERAGPAAAGASAPPTRR